MPQGFLLKTNRPTLVFLLPVSLNDVLELSGAMDKLETLVITLAPKL